MSADVAAAQSPGKRTALDGRDIFTARLAMDAIYL
jgi:hypothetical protein